MQTNNTTPAPQQKSTVKGAETQERKYFTLHSDNTLSTALWIVWVNKEQLTKKGFPADCRLPFYGLDISEAPQIAFERKKGGCKLIDAYPALLMNQWFVSDRLKQLLEQLDPQAFIFVAAQVDYSNFDEQGPAYWLCHLTRMLDCIDDENSKVTYQTQVNFKAYRSLIDIKMRPDVVGDSHAFRLVHKTGTEIVDDVFVQAMKAAKIRAWRFEPLQQY